VGGDVDTLTAPELQACLTDALTDGPQTFVIDLSNVRYISSMGLRVFLSHLKRVKANNGAMVIAGAQKLVSDVFQMSGFSNYFEIAADLQSAMKRLE
jgi:anti-anti-sigma factor